MIQGLVQVLYVLLACVASVSNRVIARKLERKQKKGFIYAIYVFFCSCPSFLDEPCEETLATQANVLRATDWPYVQGSPV